MKMERRIDDQRPSAPLEWEAKHAAMDRAGELPLERRIAERRKEPPALVTVMASTIVALKEQLAGQDQAGWVDEFGNVFSLGAYSIDGKPNYHDAHKRNWKPLYRAAAIRALASQPAAPVQPVIDVTNICAIDRSSDQGVTVKFMSARAASQFDQELSRVWVAKAHGKPAAPPVQQSGDVREAAAPTRLDVMSLIRSQMHRVYASAIDREDIDTKYMREIEDAIMGIYHGRYIAGYDLRKSEDALATTRPSAALTDDRIDDLWEEAFRAPSFKRGFARAIESEVSTILAASSGAVAVPEGLTRDLQLVRRVTGTTSADSTDGYYEAIERVFDFAESMISAAPAIPAQGQTT